jgi:hypothetical protein
MPGQASPDEGLTRREILRRGAGVGAAVIWAVPVVQSVGLTRALASQTSGEGGTTTTTSTTSTTTTTTTTPPSLGRSPGYWGNKPLVEFPAPYTREGRVGDIFGVPSEFDGVTLHEILTRNNVYKGTVGTLIRAGVAAVLNAASIAGYPLTVDQVVALVNQALASGDKDQIAAAKAQLEATYED